MTKLYIAGNQSEPKPTDVCASTQLPCVFERLTPRETDVLRAMNLGMQASEISKHLAIAESTVRSHVQAILNKLSVRSQIAALHVAKRHGLL